MPNQNTWIDELFKKEKDWCVTPPWDANHGDFGLSIYIVQSLRRELGFPIPSNTRFKGKPLLRELPKDIIRKCISEIVKALSTYKPRENRSPDAMRLLLMQVEELFEMLEVNNVSEHFDKLLKGSYAGEELASMRAHSAIREARRVE